MKGIILAGGRGTRLYPATRGVSKQLLPVYNKPMIYYPLTTLMLAGIREIMVITMPEEEWAYRRLLGDGSQWGIRIEQKIQTEPRGLADAFNVGRQFLMCEDTAALILGDNIFFGHDLSSQVQSASAEVRDGGGAVVFGYPVRDPERYGVVELRPDGTPLSIEEKPSSPRSNLAIPGLYFYDRWVLSHVLDLQPSPRGELEITDLNRIYLAKGQLKVRLFGRGMAWLDAGTHESLLQASNFIQAVEDRQGMLVGCPEEVAWRLGWIDERLLVLSAAGHAGTSYGAYLERLVKEPRLSGDPK
jgi:glucose-1-phosphate thymidylyltransferase